MNKQEVIIFRIDSELRQMINARLFEINQQSDTPNKVSISAYIRGLVELDLLERNKLSKLRLVGLGDFFSKYTLMTHIK